MNFKKIFRMFEIALSLKAFLHKRINLKMKQDKEKWICKENLQQGKKFATIHIIICIDRVHFFFCRRLYDAMLWFCDKDSRKSTPNFLSSSAQSQGLLCFSQCQANKELAVHRELGGIQNEDSQPQLTKVSYYMALCSAIKGSGKEEEVRDTKPWFLSDQEIVRHDEPCLSRRGWTSAFQFGSSKQIPCSPGVPCAAFALPGKLSLPQN